MIFWQVTAPNNAAAGRFAAAVPFLTGMGIDGGRTCVVTYNSVMYTAST
jgi:hypothetical protein